jgi:hypothetical protein
MSSMKMGYPLLQFACKPGCLSAVPALGRSNGFKLFHGFAGIFSHHIA